MQPHTRRAVAFIVGNLVSGKGSSAVYDYGFGRYFNFAGEVFANHVNIYDYELKKYVTGGLNNLFHYGNKKYIQIKLEGIAATGFDYDSRKYFSASVSGNSISIYDYETMEYYNFSV